MSDKPKYPDWFRQDPDGPHKKSGGLGNDGYNYDFFCAKDGEPWPCPAERQRQSTSGR